MPRKQSYAASETQLLSIHNAIFGVVNSSQLIQSQLHASSIPLEQGGRKDASGKRERGKEENGAEFHSWAGASAGVQLQSHHCFLLSYTQGQ